MKISFYRKYETEFVLNGSAKFFWVSAGFSKPLEPVSGMTVNLVSTDKLMSAAFVKLGAKSFSGVAEILKALSAEVKAESLRIEDSLHRIWVLNAAKGVHAAQVESISHFELRTPEKSFWVEVTGPLRELSPLVQEKIVSESPLNHWKSFLKTFASEEKICLIDRVSGASYT